MGFWAGLKKDWEEAVAEVDAEMAEADELKGPLRAEEKLYQDYVSEMKKVFKRVSNKVVVKAAKKQMKDLDSILKDVIKEKKGGTHLFPGRREKLYEEYGGRTPTVAAYNIANNLTTLASYNVTQTNKGMWLGLGTKFLGYRYLNEMENSRLQIIEKEGRALGAERVVQESLNLQAELMAEEESLVNSLHHVNPRHYGSRFSGDGRPKEQFVSDHQKMTLLLEDKVFLYTRGIENMTRDQRQERTQRTDLVKDYYQILGDLVGQPDREKTVILILEEQLEPKKDLAEQTASAQDLREVPEKLSQEDAVRQKLQREQKARLALER